MGLTSEPSKQASARLFHISVPVPIMAWCCERVCSSTRESSMPSHDASELSMWSLLIC